MRRLQVAVVVSMVFYLTGCATAINGRKQQIMISSEPAGASVSIDSTDAGTTPVTLELARAKSHRVRVTTQEHGTDSAVVNAKSDYKLIAANLLLFHPAIAAVAIGVDALTASYRKFEPRVLHFKLNPPAGALWQPAPIGAKLRVTTAARDTIVGTLLRAAADTLLLQSGTAVRAFPRTSIRSLEMSLGNNVGRGATKYLGRGMLIGIAAGAAVGLVAHGGEGAYYYGALFGLPAGLVGGAVAGITSHSDNWVKVSR